MHNLYLLQKLSIVRTFKAVPKPIVSKISAINDLRNGLAHTFFVQDLRASKRTYKGINIFTEDGLRAFIDDVEEYQEFLHAMAEIGFSRRHRKPNFRNAD